MTQQSERRDLYVNQVGGSHYAGKYQHWDYCKDAGTGYLEGHATKYLVRWRKKGGIQDLEKSLSFVDKLMVGNEETHCDRDVGQFNPLLERMFEENNVPPMERLMIYEIINWQSYNDLAQVREQLARFIADEKEIERRHAELRQHDDANTGHPTSAYANQGK
jgi:hypothetical protein